MSLSAQLVSDDKPLTQAVMFFSQYVNSMQPLVETVICSASLGRRNKPSLGEACVGFSVQNPLLFGNYLLQVPLELLGHISILFLYFWHQHDSLTQNDGLTAHGV